MTFTEVFCKQGDHLLLLETVQAWSYWPVMIRKVFCRNSLPYGSFYRSINAL
jgi:hypothetical protein